MRLMIATKHETSGRAMILLDIICYRNLSDLWYRIIRTQKINKTHKNTQQGYLVKTEKMSIYSIVQFY